MNIFSKILLFVSIFIFTLSCSKPSDIKSPDLSNFQVNEILLLIGPEIDPYTKTMQYREGLLYWHNDNRSTISKFNLSNKSTGQVLKLEYEGPNGVGSPSGFHFINQDTLVVPSSGPILFILPIHGEAVKKVNLNELNPRLSHTVSITRYTMPLHQWGNNLILNQQFSYRYSSEVTKESMEGFFPFILYDYKNNTFKDLPIHFDITSFENKYNHPTFRCAYKDSLLYTITTYSNRLYELDLETKSLRYIDLKTNLIPDFTNKYFSKEDKLGQSLDQNMELYLSEPQNFGIIVDQYKNLFYRMTWPGTGVPEGVSSMKFVGTPSHFILSVYDGDFNLKYEFDLPKYEYIPHQYFVSEQGLHLFGNHPDHPDSKEDQIRIFTFDFSD